MWTEFCNKPEDVDYLLFPPPGRFGRSGMDSPAGTKGLDWILETNGRIQLAYCRKKELFMPVQCITYNRR